MNDIDEAPVITPLAAGFWNEMPENRPFFSAAPSALASVT